MKNISVALGEVCMLTLYIISSYRMTWKNIFYLTTHMTSELRRWKLDKRNKIKIFEYRIQYTCFVHGMTELSRFLPYHTWVRFYKQKSGIRAVTEKEGTEKRIEKYYTVNVSYLAPRSQPTLFGNCSPPTH